MIPRTLLRILGWCLALGLIGASLWFLRGQLPEIRRVASDVHPRWSLVALASLVVLATYALLIETWRGVLNALGGRLERAPAAIVWLGSGLARYLPGVGWQIGVMTLMTKRRDVPVAISATTSIIITVTNLITGLVVFSVASATMPAVRGFRVWLVLAGVAALAAAPFVLSRLAAITKRVSGRDLVIPTISLRPVILSIVGTAVSWIMYGIAFWILTQSIFPDPSRSVAGCIALYTGAYMTGLLAIVPPAGLGVADVAMIELAARLGLFGRPEAVILAGVVRIWRTVLEIVPGVVTLGVTSLLERARDAKA
ncbi:MAG: lysylphosphatidylglycerol synthase domain-containing protein [Gemmatimonadaceae bacterium]